MGLNPTESIYPAVPLLQALIAKNEKQPVSAEKFTPFTCARLRSTGQKSHNPKTLPPEKSTYRRTSICDAADGGSAARNDEPRPEHIAAVARHKRGDSNAAARLVLE